MTPKSPTPGTDWLASVAAENQQRDAELERLRKRVAELELAFEGVKLPPGSYGWTWLNRFDEEQGISESTWRDLIALWFERYHQENETMRAENEAMRTRVAELEREREDVSPVPSAWPPVHMPIYDFRATSEERAGE